MQLDLQKTTIYLAVVFFQISNLLGPDKQHGSVQNEHPNQKYAEWYDGRRQSSVKEFIYLKLEDETDIELYNAPTYKGSDPLLSS